MKNQSKKSEARNIVDRIIANNDASMSGELTLSVDDRKKNNILASINRLDFSPLSTDRSIPV